MRRDPTTSSQPGGNDRPDGGESTSADSAAAEAIAQDPMVVELEQYERYVSVSPSGRHLVTVKQNMREESSGGGQSPLGG